MPTNKDRSQVRFPSTVRSPWWELSRRLVLAIVILVGTVLLVYLDRDGYRDNNDPRTSGSGSSTRSTTRRSP